MKRDARIEALAQTLHAFETAHKSNNVLYTPWDELDLMSITKQTYLLRATELDDQGYRKIDHSTDLLSPESLRFAAAVIDAFNDLAHISGPTHVEAKDLADLAAETERFNAKQAEYSADLDDFAADITSMVDDGFTSIEIARAVTQRFSRKAIGK